MKRNLGATLIIICLLLAGCAHPMDDGKLKKVGLLVPETINDQVWGTKGYKGLLNIQSRFDVEVYYKEGMNSSLIVEHAVKDFHEKGVNLIIGHGNDYAEIFNRVAKEYSDIHFVSFNGKATERNTTSLNFEAHAMGFFGGMVAAKMSSSNRVGVLASFDWQPEVKGFEEGAKYQKKDIHVVTEYVGDWDSEEKALKLLNGMVASGTDVVYPAGDGYNVPVIERIKEKGLYAIGFVSDQAELGESTVLTSTVQHVDLLYELAAEKFAEGELPSGNLSFDFEDKVITMGKYSPLVSKQLREEIDQHIKRYIKTGKLPNEN
ncbi:BMP family ABC transporter substrate-binding protein [Peribacillus glennii]|uniref:BMP family ABC transporter substrate-binding protein n=1 Tax=Peribacillus glennii TaxID=2303991 RepID=A0A372LDS8_9BACI|nr:BMP family ABC transporter substrate-binding protein [Peribacillus glennii]RFU64136.1 BMP family ABC transporter substrate-binding protein [Peribacillus glennii]